MVRRRILDIINRKISDHKVVVLVGPRQVGKTTLLKSALMDDHTIWFNADKTEVRELFGSQSLPLLQRAFGTAKRIVIDEAQRVVNIGLTLKLIYDELPDLKVIVTGSSAFDLADQVNEPLTGRKWEYMMYPLSFEEMVEHHGILQEQELLSHRMIYGYYPEVINNPGDEIDVLDQLSDSYLYKDILTWEEIKKPQKLESLVQALSFQVGNEVSYNELGQLVGLDNETVERYISLLEKAFVIFPLTALSRNLRNELKKSRKIYFYDLGIRNAVIKNWNPLKFRNDVGALWENWLIVERMKHNAYQPLKANQFFWRTHAQQEVDYIEEYGGKLHAYEFKWNPNKKIKFTKTFTNAYPNNVTMGVTQANYVDYITKDLRLS